jgi:hypothetical protein
MVYQDLENGYGTHRMSKLEALRLLVYIEEQRLQGWNLCCAALEKRLIRIAGL